MEPIRLARQIVPEHLPTAAPRHNLVDALTSFVGREREVAELAARLTSTRLLTLVGAGGVGKTRLAHHVGMATLQRYPAGVWLVELAPLTTPETIAQTVATVLGVREEPGRVLAETLVAAIRARWPLLLILDNCEHLVADVAEVAAQLLHDCPNLTVLATSREALGIEGEVIRPGAVTGAPVRKAARRQPRGPGQLS
ncbi:MAG: AAA family ATPase [Chloroflexota bacterium]